jgi:hypothetical protein
MKMNRRQYFLTALAGVVGLFAATEVSVAAGKANHHNGQQLLGKKIKTNGRHVIHTKGAYSAAVEVKGGKVAGLHVTNSKNGGEVPVKKYKTNKKMAQSGNQGVFRYASFVLVQDQYLGTTYIGYSYTDEYGDEEIYWFPYDMILDGDTGAVLYVPV